MKRLVKFLIVIAIFCFSITPVFASTNTYERTDSDYRVADWVQITDSNKDAILNTPSVDASEKVYDFADLLTDSEEQDIYYQVQEFIMENDMDLAIVTIDSNNKGSQAEYADDFYDYNDFGVGSSRDGVLFLIDMQYRQIYMSTTGDAIKMYNDSRISSIMDEIYLYMSDGDYYSGVSSFIDEASYYADLGYPDYGSDSASKTSLLDCLKYSAILSGIITVIIMIFLISKNKLVRPATNAKEYLDKKSVTVNNYGDVFLGSNTIKNRIEHSSSSSGFGGSSTHTSSSGSSHGGGGHGF